jgi:hypothetical protein
VQARDETVELLDLRLQVVEMLCSIWGNFLAGSAPYPSVPSVALPCSKAASRLSRASSVLCAALLVEPPHFRL